MQPRYITHKEIDKQRWDKAIASAHNGLIYAETFYLDTMCPGWEAMIFDDYSMLMPLPVRKKMGYHYLFQPFLTPQLGVFGNMNDEVAAGFARSLPAKFRLVDMSFNYSNVLRGEALIKRHNYILPLNIPYASLSLKYHDNINRSLSKAVKAGCRLERNADIKEVIAICKKEYPRFTKTEPGLFDRLERIYRHYYEAGRAKAYGVYLGSDLLSAAAFLFSHNRAYYWLVSNEPESRNHGSSPMLVDAFIQDHAGKEIILDFEGSDEKSVADFYRKFGAQPQNYTTIFRNKLPFPLSLFKPLPQPYRQLSNDDRD